LKKELCRGDDSENCSFSDQLQISKRDIVVSVHMVDADTLYKKCALNDSCRGPPLKLAVYNYQRHWVTQKTGNTTMLVCNFGIMINR